jgi:hypothetical protein
MPAGVNINAAIIAIARGTTRISQNALRPPFQYTFAEPKEYKGEPNLHWYNS